MLHDAEDLVHPLELKLFDRLVEYAGLVQLPVVPLIDPNSRWVGGHYADEFAEAHMKELVVREAVGAAIPLAGVGCAIERVALSRLAARHDGRPFAGASMTEDYEMGLRLGAIGVKTMFVRIPAEPGSRAVVANRGHFPSTISAAVRQKARWIGGIAFAGWDQLGWRGGLGERWMRMRDRRGPLAALLLLAGYGAAILWAEVALAAALGAPVAVPVSAAAGDADVAQWLAARLADADAGLFHHGRLRLARGLALDPADGRCQHHRSARRATRAHAPLCGRRQAVGQDPSHLPCGDSPAMSNSIRFLGAAIFAWVAVRAVSLGMIPGTQALAFDTQAAQPAKPRLPAIQPTQLPPIEPMRPGHSCPTSSRRVWAASGLCRLCRLSALSHLRSRSRCVSGTQQPAANRLP